MQPARDRLDRGLPLCPRCQYFTASNARAPRFWVSCAGRCSRTHDWRNDDANDCAAPTVRPCACSTARNAAARTLRSARVLRGNRRADSHAGSDFTARPRDELPQHRVIHPGAGEEPRPNGATLSRIGAQRPRPHMIRRTLRARTRTRPTLSGLPLPSGRYRIDAVPVTHLHAITVDVTTDSPGLWPRRILAW
jgi:hypothetical protein